MPLFDKVKAQATQVAAKAQEAGKAGQARIEQAQAKREGDALLRRLGAAVYAKHTGSTPEDDVEALVAAIAAHEEEHGAIPAGDAPAPPAAPEGDFKLE
ncbi:MAG: hypothetical protein KGL94_11700 [Acidobacteriota bacterium]|nr:hypothetical protein [Acidobacteriota bacterium]